MQFCGIEKIKLNQTYSIPFIAKMNGSYNLGGVWTSDSLVNNNICLICYKDNIRHYVEFCPQSLEDIKNLSKSMYGIAYNERGDWIVSVTSLNDMIYWSGVQSVKITRFNPVKKPIPNFIQVMTNGTQMTVTNWSEVINISNQPQLQYHKDYMIESLVMPPYLQFTNFRQYVNITDKSKPIVIRWNTKKITIVE